MPKTEIVQSNPMQLSDLLSDKIRAYISASKSPSTVRAYRSALKVFEGWCHRNGIEDPFPASPEMVSAYVADKATVLSVSSLQKHLAALGEAHRMAGVDSPTSSPQVTTIMKGIRRTHGTTQRGKSPLLVRHIRRICEELPSKTIGHRDRCLILLGFAGALRRSEVVGLDLSDLDFRDEGLVISIRRSKTDQEMHGRKIGIPYGSNPETCPVRATRAWMDTLQAESGPLFRAVDRHSRISEGRLCGRAVCLIVKRRVSKIGLDPVNFGGHSLRAGLATEAAKAGLDAVAISRQTRHRSLNTLKGYIRMGNLFTNNAAAAVGL